MSRGAGVTEFRMAATEATVTPYRVKGGGGTAVGILTGDRATYTAHIPLLKGVSKQLTMVPTVGTVLKRSRWG